MSDLPLNVIRSSNRRAGTRMGRRRAIVLIVIHLLILAHVAWWLIWGETVSPLEPSEATYALRDGAINAGTILLVVAILVTFLTGRFFCGWACHLVALQDLARWMLVKLGLRPVTIRSRALLLVPVFGAYWLFGRPLWQRFVESDVPADPAHWALTTTDFWATFPGTTLSIVTIVLTGFLFVWFVGAKGFCTYACPYGAIFAPVDRFSPARVRVNESCTGVSACTAACSSNVDVASEVATFGKIVDPGCMKCLDCVAACPNDALSYKMGSVAAFARSARKWGYSWLEEALLLVIFAGTFVALFGVYRRVPLLLAAGGAVVVALAVITGLRLLRGRDLTAQHFVLRRDGRFTPAGAGFLVTVFMMLILVASSGAIRWYTQQGTAAYERAMIARVADEPWKDDAADAEIQLARVERWGLAPLRGGGRMRGEMARWRGDLPEAIRQFDLELSRGTRNPIVGMLRGFALQESGQIEEAQAAILESFVEGGTLDRFHRVDWELDQLLRLKGRPSPWYRATFVLRLDLLRLAMERHPGTGPLTIRLCRFLVAGPDRSLRDPDEALLVAEAAVAAMPADTAADPELLAMTAFLLKQAGRLKESAALLQRAIQAAQAAGALELADSLAADLAEYP